LKPFATTNRERILRNNRDLGGYGRGKECLKEVRRPDFISTMRLHRTYTLMGSQTIVYNELRKGELKTRPIYECRCDERLKTKDEKSTNLTVSHQYSRRYVKFHP
jgi:hypothetical protein